MLKHLKIKNHLLKRFFNQQLCKYIFINSNNKFTYSTQQQFQNPTNRITIQYPFEYTFQVNQYKYYDKRFTQQVSIRTINPKQRQHYVMVLNSLAALINKKQNFRSINNSQILHPFLIEKIKSLIQIFNQEKISINLTFNQSSIQQTQGFLEIYGWDLQKSKEKIIFEAENKLQNQKQQKRYLHQLDFFRNKQILTILPRQNIINKKRQHLQQKLKEDILKKQQKKQDSQKLRKFFEQKAQGKTHQNFFKIVDWLAGINKKVKNQVQNQKDFLIVDQLKGTFNYNIKMNEQLITSEQNINFDSKWVYHVKGNQPQAIKNDRKRILFDFQFWNRGSFIPTRNFAQQILA